MNVTSESDLWMWASSSGALTAGRGDADHALFPYMTDDRLHRAAGVSGPLTIVACTQNGARALWCPFGNQIDTQSTRAIDKHVLGNRIMFQEERHQLHMLFRTVWMPSNAYGWVRKAELVNTSDREISIEVLDGLIDVMPSFIASDTEQSFSNLANAYKRTERQERWKSVAVFSMESLIGDRAEPGESLSATLVWSSGHPFKQIHIDERCVRAMYDGRHFPTSDMVVGRAGAYLLQDSIRIPPGQKIEWTIVADIGLSHAAVQQRMRAVSTAGIARSVDLDIENGSAHFFDLLHSVDAFQTTGDEIADAHHASNVLFNSMRGGLFPYEYRIPVGDLAQFISQRNHACYEQHEALFRALGGEIGFDALISLVNAEHNADLTRLVLEYLPLSFSRRHGDPSRPWNRFSIQTRNSVGEEMLSYEGNWRDIFQNWEALLYSFPAFIPSVVAKFVNASTVDGHNAYRVNRNGIEWEEFDPNNPWSNIGYWGDHQIAYLLRLLEAWQKFDPTGILPYLDNAVFVYAHVPYILAKYSDMIREPRRTVVYDEVLAKTISERMAEMGGDGRLLHAPTLVRVGLMEKLLVPALAKMTAFVPHGGVWMNTQRPEWNDANNALAGFGLSMVTLYYLRRYIAFVRAMIERSNLATVHVSRAVSTWVSRMNTVLQQHTRLAASDTITAQERRQFMDEMGEVGERYRASAYHSFDATPVEMSMQTLTEWCAAALTHLDGSINGARRRSDGLFHSYNTISFPSNTKAEVTGLDLMLEGQVAILASGVLPAATAIEVTRALFDSPLYRSDQHSFMLYPFHLMSPFTERNNIPRTDVTQHPFLQQRAQELRQVLIAGENGSLHFHPHMANSRILDAALDTIDVSAQQKKIVLDLYESVFHHHSYTGRSGSMYGYEGIGSIYWHMIGKLLLAVQDTYWDAQKKGAQEEALLELARAYRNIRDGLGYRKDPAQFGAIPIDCYSHTPIHSGAQQPGMTGQVKEGILTRIGELGIRIIDGCIHISPGLLRPQELFPATQGQPDGVEGRGVARVSFCGIPVEMRRGDVGSITIECIDGNSTKTLGLAMSAEHSAEIFRRAEHVRRVRVTLPPYPIA